MSIDYVELCAGIGGTRAGLHSIGWNCLYAIEKDLSTSMIHKSAFGTCITADILDIDPADIPCHEVLVAGFPCQPFSTTGHRSGFDHPQGHVFEAIAKIISYHTPEAILLENVQGLMYNKFGHSMACIIKHLTQLGYYVEWLVTDSAWFGIPQSRPRIFFLGLKSENIFKGIDNSSYYTNLLGEFDPCAYFATQSIFSQTIKHFGLRITKQTTGSLDALIRERSPRIGMKKPTPSTPFNKAGYSIGDDYYTFGVGSNIRFDGSLGEICCPMFSSKKSVRSVRYYARGGPSRPYVRKDPIAHCIGTSIGGAPLFSVPLNIIKGKKDEDHLLQFANWSREQDGLLVFRLSPDRAILLFGPHINHIKSALCRSNLGNTTKYKLIGNMIAPEVASHIGALVTNVLNR
jgi:site-specific DNA-cytosine methylase